MNAYELFLSDGRSSVAWACEACGVIYSPRNGAQPEAEACCKCKYCGEPAPRDDNDCYTRMHKTCWQQDRRDRQAKRLEKAEVVEQYDGWVFIDGVGPRDGYFESAEEAEDWLWDTHEDGDVLPQWAFCCTSSPPPRLDLEDVTQRFIDNGYEDIEDDLVGLARLREALELFWEENKHLVSWTPDYSRKVRLNFEGRE